MEEVTIIGHKLKRMTKHDYYAFADAGKNSYIGGYGDAETGVILIWDADEKTLSEIPVETETDKEMRDWTFTVVG